MTDSSGVTFDKTIPTLASVSIASDYSTNTLASINDVVTVSVTASEAIAQPTVTFLSGGDPITNAGAITYAGSGTSWTVAYTAHTNDTDGAISFTIAYSDLSGNAGTNVTAVTGSSAVTFDKTIPTLSGVGIVSNNPTDTLSIVNNVVTVTFTANEAIATKVVTFLSGGNPITNAGSVIYNNTSGNTWTAKYTAHTSDTDGAVTYSIVVGDLAGNPGDAVTTGTGSVTFDNTAPSPTIVTIASDNSPATHANSGDVVTVSLTTNVAISQPVVTFKSGGNAVSDSTITYAGSGTNWTATYTADAGDTEGAVSFTIAFNDLAGNAGTTITAVTDSSGVTFDKTIPTLANVSIASNNPINNLASPGVIMTLTLVAGEAMHQPVVTFLSGGQPVTNAAAVTYSGSGVNWTAAYTTHENDAEGGVSFSVAYTDLSGNAGLNVTGVTDASTVTFDKTLPSANAVGIASDNSDNSLALIDDVVSLTFTANVAIMEPVVTFFSGGQPIASNLITYSGSGDTWVASYTAGTNDNDGVISYSITYSDLAGNEQTFVSGQIALGVNITGSVALNAQPTSNAGTDQAVLKSTSVTLDGALSLDRDIGDTISYVWTQTSGPTAILSNAAVAKPTFTSPTLNDGDPPLALVFSLIVTDNHGRASTSDTVTVMVHFSFNKDPIADAGPAQLLASGSVVTLDGSSSSDPDSGDTISYQWTQIAGRAVVLSNPNVAKPTFTAPVLEVDEGHLDLIFSLVVTDNHGIASEPDTIWVTIRQLQPSEAFAAVETEVVNAMRSNAQTQMSDFTTANSAMMLAARSEFIRKNNRCLATAQNRCGEVLTNTKSRMNFAANNQQANINGATSRVRISGDGQTVKMSAGEFFTTKKKDGSVTVNASGLIRWEYAPSEFLTIGRFLGGTLSHSRKRENTRIDISSIGIKAGSYFLSKLTQKLILDGYVAGSLARNQMRIENDIMKASSLYPGKMLASGLSLTGPMKLGIIEVRPTLSLDVSKSFGQTANFNVNVGSVSSEEAASIGSSEQISLEFAPEFRLPYTDGANWWYKGVMKATPKLMCNKLLQGTTVTSCGGGFSLGLSTDSIDGKQNLRVSGGIKKIGSQTTNTSQLMFTTRF